jgi:1,4-alpha-glucan branching enzyme
MITDAIQAAVNRIVDIDPWLYDFQGDLKLRMNNYYAKKNEILSDGESLADFASAHLYYGFHRTESGWVYREWAPAAQQLYLTGDFNDWDPHSHPMTRLDKGDWEIQLEGHDALRHGQQVKVIVNFDGLDHYKIPLFIHYVTQEKHADGSVDWVSRIWDPDKPFRWTDGRFHPKKGQAPLIYEVHVGIAQEEEKIGSYREFADLILPRIQADGYNAIQLMAIMQHPYYGSFGYHVTNFFAASSWFGNPDDLKYLVNKAHKMGLSVYMDLVHSHAAKNTNEGINRFDGTQKQFFYEGERGMQRWWDSMCFD